MTRKSQYRSRSQRYPPELLPFSISAALVELVINESEKAREIYDGILNCYNLPGVQEALSQMKLRIPPRTELLKAIVKKSGYDFYKPPESKDVGIPYMRGLIKGGIELVSEYKEQAEREVFTDQVCKRDFNVLITEVDNLIRIGFNNQKDQKKGRYKVIGENSPLLVGAIMVKSLGEFCKLSLKAWEKQKVITIAGKTYYLRDVLNDEVTSRMHRYLSKQYRKAGFLLKHDHRIDNMARLWYLTRVKYSGPSECCTKLQLKGNKWTSDNLPKEITLCDTATGYPRRQRKQMPM